MLRQGLFVSFFLSSFILLAFPSGEVLAQTCNGGADTCTTEANCFGGIWDVDPQCSNDTGCCKMGVGGPPVPPPPGGGGGCPDASFTKIAGICVPTSAATGLSDKSVLDIVTNFLNWILAIAAIIAILALVISGIQYLVSAGDEDMAETAKRNIRYSLIGLVIILVSFTIVATIHGVLTSFVTGPVPPAEPGIF